MRINDLVPWRSRGSIARNTPTRSDDLNPVSALRQDIDRAFDNFWRMVPFPFQDIDELRQADPFPLDVSDNGKEVIVRAELPGMSEKDVDVRVMDGQLTIRGEKKLDRDASEEGITIRERVYGVLERTLPLPDGVETDSAEAKFKDGVLTVKLPKTQEASANTRRVPVNAH
jgi:HSP20 family protein